MTLDRNPHAGLPITDDDATIAATDGMTDLSEDDLISFGELGAFLDAHAKAKAADPGDDLVSALVGAEVEGRAMTPSRRLRPSAPTWQPDDGGGSPR